MSRNRYTAIACDYDGTLAREGRVEDDTVRELRRLAATGQRLIMVTGRIVDELLTVCSCADLFDCVVAENGAVLYWPESGKIEPLCAPIPDDFAKDLARRGVKPLAAGKIVLASQVGNENMIQEAIRARALDLQIIFNKGSIMILPSGVNKETGLEAALNRLQLFADDTIGVGDAENDIEFLVRCGCAVAVGNALPIVKERADVVIDQPNGAGVRELIRRVLQNELC